MVSLWDHVSVDFISVNKKHLLPFFPCVRNLVFSIQDNRTALHWACSAGHSDVVDFLLSLGMPVNDKDDVSITLCLYFLFTNY